MTPRVFLTVFLVFAGPLCAFAEPTDKPISAELLSLSYTEVVDQLGEPDSTLQARDLTIAIFDDLKVTFNMGIATKVETMPKVVAPDPEMRRQIGLRLKQRYLSSPRFVQLSPEEQLAAWHRFQGQYPDIDIEPQVEELRRRIAERQDAQADLESLIALREAEARLEEAKRRNPDVVILPSRHAPFYPNYGKRLPHWARKDRDADGHHRHHPGKRDKSDHEPESEESEQENSFVPKGPRQAIQPLPTVGRFTIPGPVRPILQPRQSIGD